MGSAWVQCHPRTGLPEAIQQGTHCVPQTAHQKQYSIAMQCVISPKAKNIHIINIPGCLVSMVELSSNKRLNWNRTPSDCSDVRSIHLHPRVAHFGGVVGTFRGRFHVVSQHPRRHFEVDLPGHRERCFRGTVARLRTYLRGLWHDPWRHRCSLVRFHNKNGPKPGPKLDLP